MKFPHCEGSGAASTSSSASNNDDSGWRMSVLDRGPAIAISPDGLQAQSRHQKEWHGCRANNGVSNRGMYYYEAIVTDEGLCRIGFSTGSASLDLGTQPKILREINCDRLLSLKNCFFGQI